MSNPRNVDKNPSLEGPEITNVSMKSGRNEKNESVLGLASA